MNNREIKLMWELFLVAVVLGMLIVWQMNTRDNIQLAQNPETQETVAVEVARLANSNAELRQELANLAKQEFNVAEALNNRQAAEQSLQSKKEQSDIITGATGITGPGIKMVINDELNIQQMIDILNALKNIGAEAIAVNGKRVSSQFSVWRADLKSPYTIEAIGGPAALATSLTRRGGIIDQIESSSGALELNLSEQEKLTLPAALLTPFQYAEQVKVLEE